jgi:hypothetical protein
LPSHQFVGDQATEAEMERFLAHYAQRIAPLYGRST